MVWTARHSHLLTVLVALAATVGMTWPLAAVAATHVQDLGDPLLQIWTLKWDLHQLARDPLRLYDANTFTPFPQPLAYSESMLATALLFGPLWWATGNDVLAYNLVVLLTFVGSVVTATLLARAFVPPGRAGEVGRALSTLIAGLAFAFIPYRYGHLSHLNLLSLHWLPLVLFCLLRLIRGGRPGRWAAAFAATFLLQALSSFYYAYLAAVACAVVLVVMPPWGDGRPTRPRLLGLAAAGLVIALVLTPVSLPYFGVRAALDFERTAADVDELAATPRSYLSVAPESRLYRRRLPERYPNPLFPSAVVTALAAVGLATRRTRPALALAAVGLTGLLLSFGISLNVAGREVPMPYALLYDHLPGARGLRDVARFGVLPLLALPVLAAAGLHAMMEVASRQSPVAGGWRSSQFAVRSSQLEMRDDGPTQHSPPRRVTGGWRLAAGCSLAVLACVATLAEFASGAVRPEEVPRDAETLAAYRWLAEQPRGLVIEFPADGVRGNVTRVTRTMYYSTYHWQPLLQGYSGFVPPLHYELMANYPDDRRTATPSHLNTGNVGLLRDLSVRYILFHRFQYSGGGWRLVQDNLDCIDGLAFVGQFGPTWVYTLEPGSRAPVQAELLLPKCAVTGRPYPAHYAQQNPNPSKAAHAFGGKSRLALTWRDATGRTVVTAEAAFQPGAVLEPGTRLTPLPLGDAPPPGDYALTVNSADPRLAELLPAAPLPVTVVPADAPAPAAGPPTLDRLDWPARPYRPGEAIPTALTWRATGALPGQTVFFQLIGPDNKVWGQRDGDPLDARRPAGAWLPGETVEDRRDLPISPDAPPGQYRLLVGLYDPATGRRLPIVGPDGSPPTTEVWSASITVAPRD